MGYNIAIDGPAGAGKSTIAKLVAKELGYIYVDTGAMYRTLAVHILREGVAYEEEEAVSSACEDVKVSLKYEDGMQRVLLNGEDVTAEIRSEQVGNITSSISVFPKIRALLLDLQRDLASSQDVVMDGRDIGTNVLPNAQVKIYLTASVKERAGRRYKELKAKGVPADILLIEKDISERDFRDMNRDIAPLKQAEDAYYLDSSSMTIEEVVQKIICQVKEMR